MTLRIGWRKLSFSFSFKKEEIEVLRKIVSKVIYVLGFSWGYISGTIEGIKLMWKNRS